MMRGCEAETDLDWGHTLKERKTAYHDVADSNDDIICRRTRWVSTQVRHVAVKEGWQSDTIWYIFQLALLMASYSQLRFSLCAITIQQPCVCRGISSAFQQFLDHSYCCCALTPLPQSYLPLLSAFATGILSTTTASFSAPLSAFSSNEALPPWRSSRTSSTGSRLPQLQLAKYEETHTGPSC